jgi:hypothetical protein
VTAKTDKDQNTRRNLKPKVITVQTEVGKEGEEEDKRNRVRQGGRKEKRERYGESNPGGEKKRYEDGSPQPQSMAY